MHESLQTDPWVCFNNRTIQRNILTLLAGNEVYISLDLCLGVRYDEYEMNATSHSSILDAALGRYMKAPPPPPPPNPL